AFIRVASHELRTPLTIVLGLSELAHRTTGIPPPLADWLGRIYSGSLRLTSSVDQMVKMLLAERFERPLTLKPVDLGALLRQAAVNVATFVDMRKQKLTLDLPADLGFITAEEDKLHDSVV